MSEDVIKLGTDNFCIGDLFYCTTYNKQHRHGWMKHKGLTTLANGHTHKIDFRRMIALKCEDDGHYHKLKKKK